MSYLDPTLMQQPGMRECSELARQLVETAKQHGLMDGIFYGVRPRAAERPTEQQLDVLANAMAKAHRSAHRERSEPPGAVRRHMREALAALDAAGYVLVRLPT